jgi:glycosyltransferase involved in cell wall biosynthesis
LRSIRSLIRKLDPDYVIGVMTSANVLAILAGMGLRCRVIGTEHLHPPQAPLKPVWELARRRVYRYAAAVTAPTASTADWLATHTFAERVVVVGNPISVPLTVTDPVVATTDYLEPKRKLCLAVGRLTEQKGFDLLIRAFAGVGRTHPEWALVIVGEGDSRAELESLARELHLDDQVLFPGIVGNITDWYTRAQIFVMSSRFEGFGNTLAEAMAHGCACVSFDCEAGPASIIRGPGEGILLPPEDVDALAASLDRLMSDPTLCDQFRANGQLAIGRFAVNVIGSEWALRRGWRETCRPMR